jgi:hypothetical protein
MAALDYENITVADTAIGFTASKLSPASGAKPKIIYCTLETAQIRFRYDGTDPTASEGHLMNVGGVLEIDDLTDMLNFKAIRTGGTSATLRCTFER